MYLKIILPIFALYSAVNGQQSPCTSAYGTAGQCKSIYNCQPLLNIVNKQDRTPQDLDVLKRSHCGFDGNSPAVCCPVAEVPKSNCRTPLGQPGDCISLYSCAALASLAKPPVSNDKIQYLQKSRCNGKDQYSVCCGPVPDFKEVPKNGCAATVSAFPPNPSTECCGVDGRVGNKIVGGAPTTVDQYPWLAILEYLKNNQIKTLCGGALISGKYVLTAAHCVATPSVGRPTNVRLGEYDTSHEGPDCAAVEADGEDCTDGALRIPIERNIPHPQYNPSDYTRKNDIALIRLREMAPFTDFIRPICLPTLDLAQRTDPFIMSAAGWGAVSTTKGSSAIKLHVEVPFVPLAQCQVQYQKPALRVNLWNKQMCAGGVKDKDTCKGDSGGPLMYENGRTYEAVGVVSFGPLPCGLENTPGVYTNVYEYSSWIRQNIVP